MNNKSIIQGIGKAVTRLLQLFAITLMACLLWLAWKEANWLALIIGVPGTLFLIMYLDCEAELSDEEMEQ
jgi:hypothetical protein